MFLRTKMDTVPVQNHTMTWRGTLATAASGCATVRINRISTKQQAPLQGKRIFGDYELLNEISRGSMGVVWKARQLSLNRIVALKAVSAGVLATTEDVARFRAEAETVAGIRHPNVVSIYEIGEHEGVQFFSMDYVEGRTLESMVQSQPLQPREAARILRTVAEAVHFMHMHDVMHRDIKPLNIIMDNWGRPVLLDFGIARDLSSKSRLTQTGVVMGSPCYMAPEQAERSSENIGPHTEVHALGVTLYQLITGAVPYSGTTAEETLMNVVRWTPKPPTELVPSIPHDLETIVLKCLEKSPGRRYTTAQDLADDLDRFLNGLPVLARRAKLGRRALTWLEQHPWTLFWGAYFSANVFFAAAFGFWEKTLFLGAKLAQQTSGALMPEVPLGPWVRLTGFEFFAAMGGMILCSVLIRAAAYGLRIIDAIVRPDMMTTRSRRAVPGHVLKLSVFVASIGGIQGMRSFMGFIESGIWHQSWRWEQLVLETYALAMWSVGLLAMVWRFYRAQHLGTPIPNEVSSLPPACQAAVQAAIFRGDKSHAVSLCREATEMDLSTATLCVTGLTKHLRETYPTKFRDAKRGPIAVSIYLSAMIAVCAIVPVIAFMLAPATWQQATLASLLGIFLGITLMDMENWVRKPLHQAVLFLTCAVFLGRAVLIKLELNLSDNLYLWLSAGIMAGAGIVAAATRSGKVNDADEGPGNVRTA